MSSFFKNGGGETHSELSTGGSFKLNFRNSLILKRLYNPVVLISEKIIHKYV